MPTKKQQIVKLIKSGKSYHQVAAQLNVSKAYVQKVGNIYRREGAAGLRSKQAGRPSRVAKDKQKIKRMIRQTINDNQYHNLESLGALLQKELNMTEAPSRSYVHKLIEKCGMLPAWKKRMSRKDANQKSILKQLAEEIIYYNEHAPLSLAAGKRLQNMNEK